MLRTRPQAVVPIVSKRCNGFLNRPPLPTLFRSPIASPLQAPSPTEKSSSMCIIIPRRTPTSICPIFGDSRLRILGMSRGATILSKILWSMVLLHAKRRSKTLLRDCFQYRTSGSRLDLPAPSQHLLLHSAESQGPVRVLETCRGNSACVSLWAQ